MADELLNAWERLNVDRAWRLCKSALRTGGDVQAIGMLMNSLSILKGNFTEDGCNKDEAMSAEDRPRYRISQSKTELFLDIASAAADLLVETSAESAMITASVRHQRT